MASKLGPHLMTGGNVAPWLLAGARIVKLDPTQLGVSGSIPPGPLVVGKLDQQDDALKLTDWKAMMKSGMSPANAASYKFLAQTKVPAGNRPPVNRYTANPRVDVWEDDNEIQPDNVGEAEWYSDYCIAMMRHYDSIGRKRANFSFAVGTPELDVWRALIPAIRHAHEHGHYIALHEYMGFEADYGVGWKQIGADGKPITYQWHGSPDKTYPYGWGALRYRYVWFNVLAPAGLATTNLLITEAGCDSVPAVTPRDKPVGPWTEFIDDWQKAGLSPTKTYADMLIRYDSWLRQDPWVVGAVVFTVGSTGPWKAWDIANTDVETILIAHIKANAGIEDYPSSPPTQSPDTPPPTISANLLKNPSFENGWKDAEGWPGQHPKDWEVLWNTGKNEVVPSQPYIAGEAVHKSRAQLPEHEWGQFILDGKWTFKVFAPGPKPIWVRLKQTLDLPAGLYRLTVPVVVDCYRGKADAKDFTLEPNHAQYMVKVNGIVDRDWTNLKPGTTERPMIPITHSGGKFELAVHFRGNWGTSNNFWLDGWELVTFNPPVPEPPSTPQPPPAQAGMVDNIVDMSYWQGDVNFVEMKAAGATGAIIRFSVGTQEDARVDEYVTGAHAVGLPILFGYHYFNPWQDWKAQADTFLRVSRRFPGIRAALDLEDMRFTGPSNRGLKSGVVQPGELRLANMAMMNNWLDEATTALEVVNEDGRRVAEEAALWLDYVAGGTGEAAVYSNINYWTAVLGAPSWGAKYYLWIAAWTAALQPTIPEPWKSAGKKHLIHQHGVYPVGKQFGVSSANLDLNRFNGSKEALAAFAKPVAGIPPLPAGSAVPPLATALWNDALPREPKAWNPTYALPRAIVADGWHPLPGEFQITHGGVQYTYQRAVNNLGNMRVYYAETGKWLQVKWIAGPGTTPPNPTVPPPMPPAETVDVRRAFEVVTNVTAGEARGPFMVYEHLVGEHAGRTEDAQHLVRPGGEVFLIKGNSYEHMVVTGNGVFRREDTSRGYDANFGVDTYYDLLDTANTIHRWLPAVMTVGSSYLRNPTVRIFDKNTCKLLHSATQESYAMVYKVYPSVTLAGRTIYNVIDLYVGSGLLVMDTWWERYWYALGRDDGDGRSDIRGLVQWWARRNNSQIIAHSRLADVPQGRQPLPLVRPKCLK